MNRPVPALIPPHWVAPLWFTAVAVIPATIFYASFGHYMLEDYLGFYLLPIVATFFTSAVVTHRWKPQNGLHALARSFSMAIISTLVAIAIYFVIMIGYMNSANYHLTFLELVIFPIIGFFYILLWLGVYYKYLLIMVFCALMSGTVWWWVRSQPGKILIFLSGCIVFSSFLYLRTLPSPDYVLDNMLPARTHLVDESDYVLVNEDFGYEEATQTYRTWLSTSEFFDYYEQGLIEEGWQLVERTPDSLEFRHPVSPFQVFISTKDEGLMELTIRRDGIF